MTLMQTILALAVPWCWGSVVIGALFPMLSPLGRVGIGWGVGFGVVTALMFALSLLHVPFTSVYVTLALLLCTLSVAWMLPRSPRAPECPDAARDDGERAPPWLRQSIFIFVAFVLAIGAWRNAVWPVSDWDALATYDLRGRAFARFDSVASAAQHGDLTYALTLPPFTSFAHAWVYECAGLGAPAKLLYTTCFAALIAAFLAFVRHQRSGLLAFLVVPGLVLSPLLDQSIIAYTNLPSAYAFFVATAATYHVLRSGSRRGVLLAAAFWSLTMWTRQSLEPFVAAALVALCLPWLRRRRIPWYPILAAGLLLALPYAWSAYTQLVVYHDHLWAHLIVLARSLVLIFGPAVGLSAAILAFLRLRPRPLRLAGAFGACALLALAGTARYAHTIVQPSLMRAVFLYLRAYLWPVWGPLLLVFAICLLAGIGRGEEHAGFIVLFGTYAAVFVVSTYLFAASFAEWQSIPDSALRHSFAVIPVFWACIALMPGTEHMIASVRALRPTSARLPAVQGD